MLLLNGQAVTTLDSQFPLLDKFRRIAGKDGPWLNVFGDHGASTHDCTFANRYAWPDKCISANPNLITNFD